MESLSPSATFIISTKFSLKPRKTQSQTPTTNHRFPISPTHKNPFTFYSVSHSSCSCFSVKTCAASTSTTATPSTSLPISSTSSDNRHWIVLMEAPPQGVHSKQEVIEYYVKTLQSVLGKWVCYKLFSPVWHCLDFRLNCVLMFLFSVRRMLKCVYMMLLGIPILAFAVILRKKLPTSSHVKFYHFH